MPDALPGNFKNLPAQTQLLMFEARLPEQTTCNLQVMV